MAEIELFVFLLFAVAVLAGLGLRSGVPYPVALVLGGLVIGLVPGCRRPSSTPTSSSSSSCRRCCTRRRSRSRAHELKANWAPITLLAVGLVLVTIAAVAAVANAVLGHPVGGGVRARRRARADRPGVRRRGARPPRRDRAREDDPAGRVADQRRHRPDRVQDRARRGRRRARARCSRSASSSSRSRRAGSRSGSPRAGSSPTCGGSSPTRRWTSRCRC